MMIFSLGPSPLVGHREGAASEWVVYWWRSGQHLKRPAPEGINHWLTTDLGACYSHSVSLLKIQTSPQNMILTPLLFSLFSAVGLSLTMSHSWAPRTRETAAGPAGSWPHSSPDILENVELFESKGNKSFANVNTNDCGKGLVLKERLRILGAYWVIFWQGIILGCYGNDEDKIIVIFLMVAFIVIFNYILGCKKLLFELFWLLLSHIFFPLFKFANISLNLFVSPNVPYFLWV